MVDIEISLNKQEFESKKKDYMKRWKADNPNEEDEYASYSINPIIEPDEFNPIDLKDDVITMSAQMHHDGEYIGYITIKLPIDAELAASIIDAQVKKYNKIKTVLEATK